MRTQDYINFKDAQMKELNEFPIAYAFNDEQLQRALEKLGVASVKECVSVMGHGDIVKKEDAPKLLAMFKRHDEELLEKMKDEDFAEAAFLYEMDNHEYAINWDGDDDVLGCFNLTFEKLQEMRLEDAYRRARREHMRRAHEDWGVI